MLNLGHVHDFIRRPSQFLLTLFERCDKFMNHHLRGSLSVDSVIDVPFQVPRPPSDVFNGLIDFSPFVYLFKHVLGRLNDAIIPVMGYPKNFALLVRPSDHAGELVSAPVVVYVLQCVVEVFDVARGKVGVRVDSCDVCVSIAGGFRQRSNGLFLYVGRRGQYSAFKPSKVRDYGRVFHQEPAM